MRKQLQENPVLEQEYDCGDTQNEMSELSSAQEKEMRPGGSGFIEPES